MNTFYGGTTNFSNVGWYFDKIYENEAAMYNGVNDKILTGRMVLTKNDGLIWMRNGENLDLSHESGYTLVGNSQTTKKIYVNPNGVMSYINNSWFERTETKELTSANIADEYTDLEIIYSLIVSNNGESNGRLYYTITNNSADQYPTSTYDVINKNETKAINIDTSSITAPSFKIKLWSSIPNFKYTLTYLKQGD